MYKIPIIIVYCSYLIQKTFYGQYVKIMMEHFYKKYLHLNFPKIYVQL